MRVAYLLGFLDTSVSPPRFLGVDVFSERNPTINLKHHAFEVATADGHDYEAAVEALVSLVENDPTLLWARALPTRAWGAQ